MDKGSKAKSTENPTANFSRSFFHGSKADLDIGDLIEIGYDSNYGKEKRAK